MPDTFRLSLQTTKNSETSNRIPQFRRDPTKSGVKITLVKTALRFAFQIHQVENSLLTFLAGVMAWKEGQEAAFMKACFRRTMRFLPKLEATFTSLAKNT